MSSISTQRIFSLAAVALTGYGYSRILQNQNLPIGVVPMKGALHRGNTTNAVEDTLRAYKTTPSYLMLETDLRRCKNGMVNGHDLDMNRVSNGRSALVYANATVAQITSVPLGKDGKDRIMTLEQVLALKRSAILELKDNSQLNYNSVTIADKESAKMVAAAVKKYMASARNNIVFESFNLATLKELHDIMKFNGDVTGFGYMHLVGSEASTVRTTINKGQNGFSVFLKKHPLFAEGVTKLKGRSELVNDVNNAAVAASISAERALLDAQGYSDIGFAASKGVIKCMSRQAISQTKVMFGWDCKTPEDLVLITNAGVKPILDVTALPSHRL